VAADLLVNRLGIRIENTPPYRADLKGIVERHFKTINIDMANLPGKMGKDYGERCTEDYRLNARLTLNEFISIIIHCVLLYNNYHYMEYYGKSMQMRQMNIKPVPRDLWNFGMKYLSGVQRTIDRAVVKYALLPSGKASITNHGILFKGLYYGCEEGFKEHWFDSAKIAGRESISVSYDPRDGSCIYFKPSHDSDPIECYLLDSNKIYGQFSTEELDQLRQADHEERELHRPTEDYQSILTNRVIEGIVSNAENMFPKHPDKSAHKRTSEIKANRQAEIDDQYRQSIQNTESSENESSSIPDTPVKSPIQRMLEQVLDEMY
ncbi:MAG: Mu transposase C-terminal domain-containing protein, partial [Lachnospiraceae bacterium]|nr:Mu transposase C-terminal domain-containing protein [Lachnospiraceae bacterium]